MIHVIVLGILISTEKYAVSYTNKEIWLRKKYAFVISKNESNHNHKVNNLIEFKLLMKEYKKDLL